LNALAAFGFDIDGAVLRQSTRASAYRASLDHLLADGTAFPCWCSRTDLAAAGGIHRTCVRGPIDGRVPAIRLRVEDGTEIGFDDALRGPIRQRLDIEVGDFVLFRADGLWAYQLAVVVDDAAQGVTDVVRGADLLDSTPRQILLQRALGLPTPRYAHLPLVLDTAGRKLSKSDAAQPVSAAGPTAALRRAWRQLGQSGDPRPDADAPREWLHAAVDAFDPKAIPRGDVRHTDAAGRA
jgi:glutamyl-Q tRNA(Asp) synthetase